LLALTARLVGHSSLRSKLGNASLTLFAPVRMSPLNDGEINLFHIGVLG
jgi:hypothetical protein